MILTQLLVEFVLAAIIAYVARQAHALSSSGAYAATALGSVVFGLGGWQWALLLLAFFMFSSALTHAFGRSKEGLSEKYAKGGERDGGQVVSNGGVAGLFVVLHAVFPGAAWPWIAYAGALAAVNADTWATELGVLDPNRPRLITAPRRIVEKGTSGGVSVVGTAASLLAAVLIGALAAVLQPSGFWAILNAVSLAGLFGSLINSLLGATLQAMYFCPTDQKETEKHPLHTCGTPTIHLRGWKWLNNDVVNVVCSLAGALLGMLILAAWQAR